MAIQPNLLIQWPNSGNTASQVGQTKVGYPMKSHGDINTISYTRTYGVNLLNYAPGNIGIDADVDNPNAYLSYQTDPAPTSIGSLVKYDRRFTTTPLSWTDAESYAFTYPGFTSSVTGSAGNLTAISYSTATGLFTITTNLSSPAAGNTVQITAYYTLPLGGGGTYTATASFFATVSSTGAGTILIPNLGIVPSTSSYSNVSGSVIKATPGRSTPSTQLVVSLLQYDYFLTNQPANIPVSQIFRPVYSGNGSDATVLTTNTTYPTSNTYSNTVTNGGYLIAESKLRRWEGNIWERVTRTVLAQ